MNLPSPLHVYQLQRALSRHAMLGQCALVVLELLARKKQLLPLHRDLRCLTDSGADMIDRVHGGLRTDGRHSCAVWRRDGYRHAYLYRDWFAMLERHNGELCPSFETTRAMHGLHVMLMMIV